MTIKATSQQEFVSGHYASRAQDYVTSVDHSIGDDLDQIEDLVRRLAPARVLDLGCGGGHVTYRASAYAGEVVACDVTPSMLDAVRGVAAARGLSNVSTQEAAAELLPFREAEFDMVLCRYTVHHWQSMQAGLREARRVLKAGCLAMFVDVVAPADPVLDTHLQTFELMRDASHVRNYSVAEWVAALARSGFSIEGMTPRKLPLEFAAWTARTRTPETLAQAIRAVQEAAPEIVKRHFQIREDGSFQLDTVTLVVRAV